MTDQTINSDDNTHEVNELLQKKDFGADLKKAREKRGLSITDVAENLLISADVIKALENSQAESLPALTFTQGYIRSYSRLLGVSADKIIDEYVQMAPDSKQVLMPHSVLPVQKSSSDSFMRFISLSFVVIALVIFVYWFYETDFKLDTGSIKDVVGFEKQQVHNVESKNKLPFNNLEIEKAEESSEDFFLHNESLVEEIEEIKSSDVDVDLEKEVTSGFSNNQDEIVLTALGDSWCEIKDSAGNRLYYQLLSNGDEVKLLGVAPFIVFLGNAPDVRVEVNSKIVNFEGLINKSSNIVSIEISSKADVIGEIKHIKY